VVERSDTTGIGRDARIDPGRGRSANLTTVELLKVSGIIFDSGLGQHVEEFVSGRARSMMFLLIRNVLLYRRPRGRERHSGAMMASRFFVAKTKW
jgi:hypothetical protein